jgi:hypothetical protein
LEYRVVWQREGSRPKERRYKRRSAAERQFDFLTSDPHGRCDHDGQGYESPPWCVWDRHGYDESWAVTEPPPWLLSPRLEEREVGYWRCGAYGQDHSDGCPAAQS